MIKEGCRVLSLLKKEVVLTKREIEYLSMAALGFKNWRIAEILSVTRSTVKKTLENIYKELNAKDRANAVTLAFIAKIITSESLAEIEKKYNL